MMKEHHVRFLEQFVPISIGDLVLLPAYQKRYQAYLGIVIAPRRQSGGAATNACAYYYHFDIASGDWFDNAHRVDVKWAKPSAGLFQVFHVPEVGGTWIRGFGEVKAGTKRILSLAQRAGLVA
jgi:hypothetical protein